jgi:hypothetical protein
MYKIQRSPFKNDWKKLPLHSIGKINNMIIYGYFLCLFFPVHPGTERMFCSKSKYNVFLLAHCCNTRLNLNFRQVPIDVTKGPETIECFIEDQASHRRMIWLLPRPPPLPSACYHSFSFFLCVARSGGVRGWGRSQIRGRRESLVYVIQHSLWTAG